MRWTMVSLVLGSALLVMGCSTDDSFAVGEDTLCEWLTEEQVAEAAQDGYSAIGVDGWDGEASVVDEVRRGRPWRIVDECWWELGEGVVIEARLDRFPLFDWEEIEIATHEEWRASVDTRDQLLGPIERTGIEHPALDDGVVAVPLVWGSTAFGTPGSDDVLVVDAHLGGEIYSVERYDGTIGVAAALMDALAWPAEG